MSTESTFKLRSAPFAQPESRGKIASWLNGVIWPVELGMVGAPIGTHIYARGNDFGSSVDAFSALTRHALRWVPDSERTDETPDRIWMLRPTTVLPFMRHEGADPFLTWAGQLQSVAQRLDCTVTLHMYVYGQATQQQRRLRALSAYNYGTRIDEDDWHLWAVRLRLWRSLLIVSGGWTAVATGATLAGWVSLQLGLTAILAGAMVFFWGLAKSRQWLQLRSIPREVLERFATGSLLRVSFALAIYGAHGDTGTSKIISRLMSDGMPFADSTELVEIPSDEFDWDRVADRFAFPVPAWDLAALLTPAEDGDPSTVLHPDAQMTVPSPPPSRALQTARFRVGRAAAGGEPIGIDPDGHGLIVGGSQSGKSSLAYSLLRQLLDDADPPGVFLVDPHESLADAFLSAIAELPSDKRAEAVDRLFIVTPDQPEVVPLNLLAVPEYTWAGNTIIEVGKRIWGEYWGPRMEAAFQALFRLAHSWNMATEDPMERLSLFHLVFAAFRERWRREAMMTLPPEQRMSSLALNTLLGQFAGGHNNWHHAWLTKVISPIISKVMAVELAPWLFAALHQPYFVNMEEVIEKKKWIILRVPAGKLGREGSRLLSAVVYNLWESAFRRVARPEAPVPYYVIVDEAQEIAEGMQLESLLSEGAKFGARVFVLTQSLTMLRQSEGFTRVVQSLLANTSTQAFFSPDPEDSELVRDVLSSRLRYGDMTLDLPTLTCWLRARVGGRWQSPVLMETSPLTFADSSAVSTLVRDVIDAHPEYYSLPDSGVAAAIHALQQMLPDRYQELFEEMMGRVSDDTQATVPSAGKANGDDTRARHVRLGF